jgi:hypothetical protein
LLVHRVLFPNNNRIEFDEPRTLEETIRKVRYCYEQFGNKTRPHEDWKKGSSSGFRKKGFKSLIFKNYGKYSRRRIHTGSVYQQNFPSQSGNKPYKTVPEKTDNLKKEPIK